MPLRALFLPVISKSAIIGLECSVSSLPPQQIPELGGQTTPFFPSTCRLILVRSISHRFQYMTTIPTKPSDNSREALSLFLQELEAEYQVWYARAAARCDRLHHALFITSVVSGFGTSVLAALLKDEYFHGYTWGRIVLITLPFLGSLASTLRAQTRVQARWKLREDGRRTIKTLADEGKRKYADASSSRADLSEFARIYKDLQRRRDELEEFQSNACFELTPQDKSA